MVPNTNYGTASEEGTLNGTAYPSSETSPLLSKTPQTLRHQLHSHLTKPVSRSWADLLLLTCYFITGLLDSSAVFIWGSFVSMQTGNTVYLGLGLVEPASSDRWIRSLISIGSFCLGSFCFAAFHRNLGARKRWVVVTSFATQMCLIIAAAIMVTLGSTKGPGTHWHVVVPIALLAFQSSGQTVASRVMQYSGLPSVVLTSTYCDLLSDPKLFTAGLTDNPERNRRIVAPMLLLAGACSGGLFAKSPVGLAGAVWTAAGLKACIVCSWMVWKEDEEV
jgi:uncharacterized membrane protein YoaK (UPF0700 family)